MIALCLIPLVLVIYIPLMAYICYSIVNQATLAKRQQENEAQYQANLNLTREIVRNISIDTTMLSDNDPYAWTCCGQLEKMKKKE